MGQFPAFRIPTGSRLPMASDSPASNVRGDLGHDAMPAKALEFLPRWGSAPLIRRPDDPADDLISSARTVLWSAALTGRK